MNSILKSLALLTIFLTALGGGGSLKAQNQDVFTDSLQNTWEDWSWASVNLGTSSPVQSGSKSIAVTADAYEALYLHHPAQDSTPYVSLSFWINGGAGGQHVQVQATLSGNAQAAYALGPLAANSWQQVTIPLTTLGVANNPNFDGFWIQDTTGTTQAKFYVDTISLIAGKSVVPTNSTVVVEVNAASHVHAISPLVYGVNFATKAQVADLRAPVNRMGGNNQSRYNWQVNADNKDNDYFFESIGDDSAVAGARADTFIGDNKAAGADTLMTIPMLPWVAKLGPNRAKLAGFSVAKYGAQQSTDPYMPDAGNGVRSNGQVITGNDPNDADVPNSTSFENGWIQHLTAKWGLSATGGLKYYIMDNEPSIWHSTHRDVFPTGLKMNDLKNDIIHYAALVKKADPKAQVVGPEEWGWEGYFYSGYDQQYSSQHGYTSYPDKAAHNNMDYVPWLLHALYLYDKQNATRSLDVFSLHYYPQSGEFSNDTSTKMQLLRNQSTRELWDPNYTSKSWINDKVQLIPRMKGWVKQYYPGLKTAITEYNWGAESSMSGATTQADIYGIFGREGLDLATRWTTPDANTPTYLAMKMYRNYDSKGGAFGETSVYDLVPNPDNVSSFASLRASDGALTVMVVNKTLSGNTPILLKFLHFTAGAKAQVWQLTSANTIKSLPAIAVVKGVEFKVTVPEQSVTLLVIPKG